MKLFDSELKVMAVLWREGDSTAKRISDILKEEIGWNVSKSQVQASETDELIDRIYDGSADMLFASLLSRKALSGEQIERLKRIVEEGK